MKKDDVVLQIIMPSAGDMTLVSQEAGTINLSPVYYGAECMGPHFQLVKGSQDADGRFIVKEVLARFKLTLKDLKTGVDIKMKKGGSSED